jgi:hypothetical protein
MKTIAEQIKWDFKTNGDLEIRDKNGNLIYYENSKGFWAKCEYDSNGNTIYFENSDGFWAKCEYDSNGNTIYFERSDEYWAKWEYDSQGNQIYYENSYGTITDNQPNPCENKVVEIEGVKYKLVKQ